jgi:hypothetical protein
MRRGFKTSRTTATEILRESEMTMNDNLES